MKGNPAEARLACRMLEEARASTGVPAKRLLVLQITCARQLLEKELSTHYASWDEMRAAVLAAVSREEPQPKPDNVIKVVHFDNDGKLKDDAMALRIAGVEKGCFVHSHVRTDVTAVVLEVAERVTLRSTTTGTIEDFRPQEVLSDWVRCVPPPEYEFGHVLQWETGSAEESVEWQVQRVKALTLHAVAELAAAAPRPNVDICTKPHLSVFVRECVPQDTPLVLVPEVCSLLLLKDDKQPSRGALQVLPNLEGPALKALPWKLWLIPQQFKTTMVAEALRAKKPPPLISPFWAVRRVPSGDSNARLTWVTWESVSSSSFSAKTTPHTQHHKVKIPIILTTKALPKESEIVALCTWPSRTEHG